MKRLKEVNILLVVLVFFTFTTVIASETTINSDTINEQTQTDDLGLIGSFLNIDQINLAFGSETIDDQYYLYFKFQPELHDIFGSGLNLSLDIPLFQDFEGNIYYGSIDENVKLNNMINWIEYDGHYLYFYYGFMENITYGYGLLMGNYSKSNSRGFQLGLDHLTAQNLGSRVLLPFDIVSFSPWEVESTSSLYALRLTKRFGEKSPFIAGLNFVTDTNSELKNLEYDVPLSGFSLDLGVQLHKFFKPYVEFATLNNFGSAGEIGFKGGLFPGLNYQMGFQVLGENYTPNYFGGAYESYKYNSLIDNNGSGRTLPEINANDYPFNQGLYGKVDLNIGSAFLNIAYKYYTISSNYAPVLSGNLETALPFMQGKGGFNYRQVQFKFNNEETDWLLNNNTDFTIYIDYPVQENLNIRIENIFIPSNEEREFKRNLSFSFNF